MEACQTNDMTTLIMWVYGLEVSISNKGTILASSNSNNQWTILNLKWWLEIIKSYLIINTRKA